MEVYPNGPDIMTFKDGEVSFSVFNHGAVVHLVRNITKNGSHPYLIIPREMAREIGLHMYELKPTRQVKG